MFLICSFEIPYDLKMRNDLDISLLRAFTTIVDAGGVTRAAAALGVSQAAASQQVRRLEEMLDCRLFERVGRRLALAPAGERLLAQARRLLALNDEVWSSMRTPSFEGEVRLGVPYDIIASFVPPVLRRFAKAQPRVRVSLVCEDSRIVREQLASGRVDLALTTERDCGRHGETLRTDRLVWVGVPGGDAHLRDPLPVSLGASTCVFRPVAVEALGKARRDWRAVCEVSRMEPVYAAIEAGLAVAPLLRSSVPERFDILGRDARLPTLPEFRINLYAPPGLGPAARDLADHVRASFAERSRRPHNN
jgi:DNA-binding transcriptional LysR family regulator